MPNTALPKDREPTLRLVAMPQDTNWGGTVFGGWIMSQVDIAASIPAIQRAQGRVATVAVNAFEFHFPVYVGDLVSFYASIVKVGNTSITIYVEVFAQRFSKGIVDCVRVTEATLTYVALDENRKPRIVPPSLDD